MKQKNRSRQSTAKHSARLGAYLAAGLGASTVATPTADAAIVIIDLASVGSSSENITGVNGGLPSDDSKTVGNFPFSSAGNLGIYNFASYKGLSGSYGFRIAANKSDSSDDFDFASPTNFALNATIDGGSNFTGDGYYTFFNYGNFVSPSFGPGSYMGFRTATNNYGWLEVTWDSATKNFEILSGAYEDQVGVGILAGATAVPEPSSSLLTLVAGGAAFARRRRQRAA